MAVASESVQVSRKVSSVKWLSGFSAAELDGSSRLLASGTWDDRENRLQVWLVEGPKRERFAERATLAPPALLQTVSRAAAITGIETLEGNRMVVSGGDGSLELYHVDETDVTPVRRRRWDALHRLGPDRGCECTAVATCPGDAEHVATAGEDGVVNYFQLGMLEVRSGDVFGRYGVNWSTSADGELGDCVVRCAAFRNRSEILSGDSLGQLQQWDVRRPGSLGPVVSMHSEQPQSVVHDIAMHPDHNYAVAATDGDGSVVVWDVRHPTYPQSITAVHRAWAPEVWRVRFNPVRPDHIFTTGEDGALVHWNTASAGSSVAAGGSFAIPGDVDTTYLSQDCLGISALDVEPELVAYGNDEEKLVVVVPVY